MIPRLLGRTLNEARLPKKPRARPGRDRPYFALAPLNEARLPKKPRGQISGFPLYPPISPLNEARLPKKPRAAMQAPTRYPSCPQRSAAPEEAAGLHHAVAVVRVGIAPQRSAAPEEAAGVTRTMTATRWSTLNEARLPKKPRVQAFSFGRVVTSNPSTKRGSRRSRGVSQAVPPHPYSLSPQRSAAPEEAAGTPSLASTHSDPALNEARLPKKPRDHPVLDERGHDLRPSTKRGSRRSRGAHDDPESTPDQAPSTKRGSRRSRGHPVQLGT